MPEIFVRPRKDGGISECTSPDHLVGRGRCVHVLDGGDKLAVEHVSRGVYRIEVNDSSLSVEAQKKSIVDFFKTLPKMKKEQRERIIHFLERG
jgi:hypothetical protein